MIKTTRYKIFNDEELKNTLDAKVILDNMNNFPRNIITLPFKDPKIGRHTYCPKQQIKETTMQMSELQGTSLH